MWLYRILRVITSFYVKRLWLKSVSGTENIPKTGGVIIAPNHQSLQDHYFMTSTIDRRLYFLIGEFAWAKKVQGWALRKMGHIKVNRFHPNKAEVYEKAKKILDEGNALVVFPEGRVTKDGYTQKGFKGVAKMALASKVDIVPAVIKNSYPIHPVHNKKAKLWGMKCCEVKYLKRIKYEDFKDKSLEDIVHKMIMKEIANELGHPYDHKDFDKDIKDESERA